MTVPVVDDDLFVPLSGEGEEVRILQTDGNLESGRDGGKPLRRVLEANGWHRGNACEILGISRPRLRRMIKQHHLTPPSDSASEDKDFQH